MKNTSEKKIFLRYNFENFLEKYFNQCPSEGQVMHIILNYFKIFHSAILFFDWKKRTNF